MLYGDPSQFGMQLIDAGVVAVFGFVMAYVWFKISDLITPIRVATKSKSKASTWLKLGCRAIPICLRLKRVWVTAPPYQRTHSLVEH